MERSNFVIKVISVVAFVAIVCYIGYYFVDARLNPLTTAPAASCTVEESSSVTGFAVRSEAVLSGGGDNVVLAVGEGDKLAAGQVIATEYHSREAIERVSAIRETELRIDQLEDMLLNFSEATGSEQAAESVFSLAYAVKSGNLSELGSLALEVETHIFDSDSFRSSKELEDAIAVLEDELVMLQASTGSDIEFIFAEYPGIFSAYVDGYEHISPDSLNDSMTPAALADLFSSKSAIPNSALGKMISDITWYYAAVVDAAAAQKLEPGQTVEMRFSKTYSSTLDMNVEFIGPEEGGDHVVVFSSNRYMSDIAPIRDMTADIIFTSISGIRIPKEAVHLDTEGNAFVYLLSGLQAQQTDVEIIGESDGFYVVEKDASGAIRDGAEIIVSAKDLHDGKVIQ